MNDGTRATTVQKRASVHEKAVQAVARGEVGQMPTQRRRGAQRRSLPVHKHIKLTPLAAAAVAEVVKKGVYTKVTIIDEETAVIR